MPGKWIQIAPSGVLTCMDLEKRPEPEGCLVVAVRLPVRIVALVLVVPVRLAWDALTVVGRVLYERVLVPLARVLIVAPARWLYAYLLTPLGHAIAVLGKGVGVVLRWLAMAVFVWPWVALWRYVLVPVGLALAWLARVLIAIPAGWLYTYLLTPLGRALAWLVRVLVVVPCAWFYVSLLTPLGHALRWTLLALGRAVGTLFRWVFVVPVLTLWRWVLVPAGRALGVLARETGAALVHAWRVAGYVSLAVGRFLGRVLRWLLVDPARWIYRHLLTPVGHVVRDQVWRPVVRVAREVRASVRQARAELRRALFGTPSPAETRPEPQVRALREPEAAHTRSLGKSTTALTKD